MSGKQQTRQQRRGTERRSSRGAKSRTWWILGGVVLVILALTAVIAASGSSDVSTDDAAVEPNNATDVAMLDFEGNTVTISDLEGQPVVVNFWASWCAPCLAEMPGFERVYQTHRDSVQFLGVNLTDDIEPALAVVARTGVTYPLARDVQGEAFTAFGGFGMPTTVFLDESGEVVEMYTGELTADELEARIVKYFES